MQTVSLHGGSCQTSGPRRRISKYMVSPSINRKNKHVNYCLLALGCCSCNRKSPTGGTKAPHGIAEVSTLEISFYHQGSSSPKERAQHYTNIGDGVRNPRFSLTLAPGHQLLTMPGESPIPAWPEQPSPAPGRLQEHARSRTRSPRSTPAARRCRYTPARAAPVRLLVEAKASSAFLRRGRI